jgi:hypothetical protein
MASTRLPTARQTARKAVIGTEAQIIPRFPLLPPGDESGRASRAVGTAQARTLLTQAGISGDPTALVAVLSELELYDLGFREGFLDVLIAAVLRKDDVRRDH